jgi:predicted SAM-dependent methyltransferase
VLVAHVLEHLDREDVAKSFGYMTKALVNQGEIWVLVPSMEWAAAEILAQRHTIGVEAHIFGRQDNIWAYHRSGYTLKQLRILFENEGLLVKKAFQAPYAIEFERLAYHAIQNIVIGARYDGLHDPTIALD